jgi:hypothetical protein
MIVQWNPTAGESARARYEISSRQIADVRARRIAEDSPEYELIAETLRFSVPAAPPR